MPDGERARLGQELLRVHGHLRARLHALPSTLDTGVGDAEALQSSCLAFCRALRRHHVGEDDGVFPVLRRHDPALGEVLDDLVRDHAFIDPMLDRLELLLANAGTDRDVAATERELAGIAAVLENHLAYEERVLVSVLDTLQVEAGSGDERLLRAPLDGVVERTDP